MERAACETRNSGQGRAAMRRPHFDRWIKRQVLELANAESFSLRKFAALAQKEIPRLREPLLLYAIANGCADKLLSYIYKDEVLNSYKIAFNLLKDVSLTEVALNNLNIEGLPREYSKFFTSYKSAYNKPQTNSESKRMRWERSRMLQLEKGVNTADIYRSLGLNPGNVNAYMKHGALDKVSLENATEIMKYLHACA